MTFPDASIVWVASMVLHPRFKFQWFDEHWSSTGKARSLVQAKAKLRKLWEKDYKTEDTRARLSTSPEPPTQPSYLEEILNSQAPTISSSVGGGRASSRKDELH